MQKNLFVIIFQLTILSSFILAEDNQTTCWSPESQYIIIGLNENQTSVLEYNTTELELIEQCHLSFVEKITRKTCYEKTSPSRQQPSFLQKYGLGFLSVFIISVLSLAGFVAFPLMKKPYYKYFNAFFTALAVGTLFADSAFELFPVIIKYDLMSSSHVHEHAQTPTKKHTDEKIHIPLFLWQMMVLLLTAYVFYVVELLIHGFMHHRQHRVKKNSYDLNHTELPTTEMSVIPVSTVSKSVENDGIISTNTLPNLTITADEKQEKSVGWMIIIGDGIHNVADGLAIGAAFAENTMFGVTTAIAIACHELPTELGEYMVLIESGFTFRRALLFNFISACTAIIGFFIGASIAQDEASRTWIFAITAGTFAYIALVDLWPTLMPETKEFDWIRFICVTLGYLSGVCIMFILSIFEERIIGLSDQ